MAAGRPVISCDNGGPCETVLSGKTGFLVANTPQVRIVYTVQLNIFSRVCQAFADAMFNIYGSNSRAHILGLCARKRVEQMYSFERFATEVNMLTKIL